MTSGSPDVLVVGAGVAGLACARDLARAGHSVVVFDKGRSVGGRCSTWRTESGHCLDYGVTFLHGTDREFLAELDGIEGVIPGWPLRTLGHGDPCQPRALAAHEHRVGLAPGVSALPKHLAAGLDVRTRTTVQRLVITDGRLGLEHEGARLTTDMLVLALPCEQARELLTPLSDDDDEISGMHRLLGMLGTVPCLTVLATYDRAPPEWRLLLPDASRTVQLVANESSKRPDVPGCALVVQARPDWSATHLEKPPECWAAELLREAAAQIGDWVTAPTWSRTHRWRYARADLATELSGPFLYERGGARLGLVGELFSRGTGVQAAYTSGRALARRIVGDDHD